MQVAICTDIHGNRHAFEAVIDAAGGNVHGYSVWPADKTRTWGVWKD